MLKQRVLTATLLIPLMVWYTMSASSQALSWVLSIFIIFGAWEWAAFCQFTRQITRSFYVIIVGLTLLLIHSLWYPATMTYILLAAGGWWLIAFYWVFNYQQGYNLLPKSPIIKALIGILVLLPAWAALIILHQHYGGQWVIFLLVLIWSADTGAYFVGKTWGHYKLADKISPGKTWEGVAGALVICLLPSLTYAWLKSMSLMTLIGFMLLCIITVLASILGDLLESLFKRQVGIKNSSQLLPGHGGILDRIDSITSAAPIFVSGLILLFSVGEIW